MFTPYVLALVTAGSVPVTFRKLLVALPPLGVFRTVNTPFPAPELLETKLVSH
jgi:hypothetical protein